MGNETSQQPPQNDAGKVSGPPPSMLKALRAIDWISIWFGRLAAVLIFPMIFSLVWEVTARYFFNAPTIWANDLSTMLYGAMFMIGSAYALQRQQHIRTDWLYEKWSIRTRAMVDSACYILLYFPGLAIFLWVGWKYALRSTTLQERIISSPWMPIIWPLKLCIPIATLLLLIQGISELTKSLYALKTGLDIREETEGVET